MRNIVRALLIGGLMSSLLATSAGAAPPESRDAALKGADRLLAIQFEDGSFPWIVGDPGVWQNVQGITAIGLLDAYKVSLDDRYLTAAGKTRDWLADYRASCLPAPPCLLSAPNVYFLAEYALLSGNVGDLALARAVLGQRVDRWGGSKATILAIIQARKNQGHTNLGLWDAALYVRAAQDVGWTDTADRMAKALASQTIVDPFDSTANWYELGLTGLLMGLSEADLVAHKTILDSAAGALEATQAANGSFPSTYGGTVFADDIQGTAYAVLGLASIGHIPAAQAGASFLISKQETNGGWLAQESGLPGQEFGETDSEATMALVAAALPVPNGVVAYADTAVGYLP